MYYVKWAEGQPRRGRTFDHIGTTGVECVSCEQEIHTDSPVTLMAVGPVDDEDKVNTASVKWFLCGAAPLHASCADQLDEASMTALAAELTVSDG